MPFLLQNSFAFATILPRGPGEQFIVTRVQLRRYHHVLHVFAEGQIAEVMALDQVVLASRFDGHIRKRFPFVTRLEDCILKMMGFRRIDTSEVGVGNLHSPRIRAISLRPVERVFGNVNASRLQFAFGDEVGEAVVHGRAVGRVRS